MKTAAILAAVLIIIIAIMMGFSAIQYLPSAPGIDTSHDISGTRDLILDEQDLQQLGMAANGCQTDDGYSNIVDSTLGQYSFCNYTITALNGTEVIVELQKFADYEALNGSYQYSSLHLYSAQGIISENDFGDQSRFRANNVNDYGGQYNDPNVHYYHLWICKGLYLIHITSGGPVEAEDYVARIGRQILSKF